MLKCIVRSPVVQLYAIFILQFHMILKVVMDRNVVLQPAKVHTLICQGLLTPLKGIHQEPVVPLVHVYVYIYMYIAVYSHTIMI